MGKSSSSQSQNVDKRVVVQDGIGISGDSNRVVVNTSDYGAIAGGVSVASKALDAVSKTTSRALDSVDKSTALVGKGYEDLIEAAGDLFNRGERMIGQTQQAVQDAYRTANTDAKGTIDNKTIIVLGVAAATVAGVVAYSKKKG